MELFTVPKLLTKSAYFNFKPKEHCLQTDVNIKL